ncbi:choice-of-anchor B family protein [Glycomyces sp. L485]|uniref:choice-of-anchor B family protein n=1 Tax=Glycomyces sp. L485 TaxID=2909235 RepID=UPI001F4B5E4B|nr:choice-of-anchor B family protein [Glycomyces sp. L485]MCH7230941.1 choice-of-anchor B family protein [Glycomyces sp. L485]
MPPSTVPRRFAKRSTIVLAAAVLSVGATAPAFAHDDPEAHQEKLEQFGDPIDGAVATSVSCENGSAGEYRCSNVDLLAHMPLNTIGGGSGNDIWGWTDPETGGEYALMGRSNGTGFIDISDPENPVYLGNLPTATSNSSWRDLKVHDGHAYIVSEAEGHGLQVFDLTRLRGVTNPPQTFNADARDTSFGSAHNVAVNEESGMAYVIGSGTCSGGPRVFDLADPAAPSFAGCISGDGYTHDTQAVVYRGPDSEHQGKEILFNSNEDTITIVDATSPSNPVQLSRTGYEGAAYTHQGWLTEDHRYFLVNDELDEARFGHNTRTRVFDVSDLDDVSLVGYYDGETKAIDHNFYVKGDHVFESNYQAGLRIVDLSEVANPAAMEEVAYFDVHPDGDSADFNGAWSNYPYFDSGTVIVSSIERGLFVLRPDLDAGAPAKCAATSATGVDLPDRADITSAIDLDCDGTAGTSSRVTVDIDHTYRGDLVIDLIAPDGTGYPLKQSAWDSRDDVKETYTVDLSGHQAAGTWTLRVRDVHQGDSGRLNSWTIDL